MDEPERPERPERRTPLGAPTDLLRPTGRVNPSAPRPGRRASGFGLGVVLGLAWGAGSWLLLGTSRRPAAAVAAGAFLCISAYAFATRRKRLLLGFWAAVLAALILHALASSG